MLSDSRAHTPRSIPASKHDESDEMKSALITLLELRLVVGYLGERSQHAWWSTAFFGEYSLRSLEIVAPKTSTLAQYNGVVEAARRVHDEHLSIGSYHLFRLPEEAEQDLHAAMQSATGSAFAGDTWKEKAAALTMLMGFADENLPTNVGPVAIGNISDIYSSRLLQAMAGNYSSAFAKDFQTYPYMLT